MKRILYATLEEVLEVRGCPLDDDQLWALLRNLINILARNKNQMFSLGVKHILLFPAGNIEVIKCSSSSHLCETINNQLQNVALVILHCAGYQLSEEIPLNISPKLQTLLDNMSEDDESCTIEHLQDVCNHQMNAQCFNDKKIISEMCCSILGSISKINGIDVDEYLLPKHTAASNKSSSLHTDKAFSCAASSVTSSRSKMSSKSGKMYDSKIPLSTNETFFSKPQASTKVSYNTNNIYNESSFSTTLPFSNTISQNSVLNAKEEVPNIYIDSDSSTNESVEIQVCYFNYTKVKLVTRNSGSISLLSLLQSSLTVFLNLESTVPESIIKYFALGAWKDSDFYFFANDTTLDKVLKEFSPSAPYVFYIRILYFPPEIASLDRILLTAMYVQIRADIVHERILCSHDEVLAFTALSLQCELGDYKPEYGCDYFVIEEFLPPHVVMNLGLSCLRSKVPSMHKQLAGISKNDARLLFLKKNQNLDEYGMEFSKVYRLKSCKEEHSTWIGAGPEGIINFDIKEDICRIKRHSFQWKELKKISFKGRKIVLSRLNPEYKLKFYLKDTSRAKYLVALIGKLHEFHSLNAVSRDLSALSLFDDMTKISTNRNRASSPLLSHSTFDPANSRFRRSDKAVRRASNSAASSLGNSSRDPIDLEGQLRMKETPFECKAPSDLSSEEATKQPVMHELRSVLTTDRFCVDTAGSSFLSDSDDGEVSDEGPAVANATRPVLQSQRVATSQPMALRRSTSASSSRQNPGCDIHKIARNFYRNSLPGSPPFSPTKESNPEVFEFSSKDSD